MDFESFIISIVLIIICIIPFAVMGVKNKKRKNELIQRLTSLAEENNSQITRQDLWDNSGIGIDAKTQKTFFIKMGNDGQTAKHIDLAEIQTCRVLLNNRAVNPSFGSSKAIEYVDLVFTYNDKSKKETALEFFNAEHGIITPDGELQLAEKWAGIINDVLLTKSK